MERKYTDEEIQRMQEITKEVIILFGDKFDLGQEREQLLVIESLQALKDTFIESVLKVMAGLSQ